MKVLTLNTWNEAGPWKQRWEIIFDGIRKYNPDIIGFQEIFNPEWPEEVRKKTGYPHLVFHKEPSGLMILSRFPVIESACLTMKTRSPTEDYLRYVLFARLEIKGRRLSFFNTHLSWKPNEGKVRSSQVEELLGFMDAKAGKEVAVATGDFNAAPETPEIRKIREQGKLTDVYAALYPGEKGYTWNNENDFARDGTILPDRRIDHIYIRNAAFLKPEKAEIIYQQPVKGVFATDHYGLLAEFKEK